MEKEVHPGPRPICPLVLPVLIYYYIIRKNTPDDWQTPVLFPGSLVKGLP